MQSSSSDRLWQWFAPSPLNETKALSAMRWSWKTHPFLWYQVDLTLLWRLQTPLSPIPPRSAISYFPFVCYLFYLPCFTVLNEIFLEALLIHLKLEPEEINLQKQNRDGLVSGKWLNTEWSHIFWTRNLWLFVKILSCYHFMYHTRVSLHVYMYWGQFRDKGQSHFCVSMHRDAETRRKKIAHQHLPRAN